jgi:BASS family bile acid:Na+ symporter
MLGSLATVLVLVPLAALALLLLLRPVLAVTVGLAVLVSSPAAALMLVSVPKKGGSLADMACLHLSLAALAVVTVPLTLYLFSRALGFEAEVDAFAVARVVGKTVLIPVGAGMLIRAFLPKPADSVGPVLAKVASAALMVLVLVVVAGTYGLLLKLDAWSYLVMAAVVIASLAIGHVLGPRDAHERTTLAMECAARHPGLAMSIAALNFSPQQALPVLVPYMLVFVLLTTIYAKWRQSAYLVDAPLDQGNVG